MKPTFALDFRDGQVTLLHRTSRGWSLVGSAAFGAADFDETLAYLRSTALGLQPRGITTKLILPNDQILYTEVEVGASDGSRRRRLIRLALEGKTPYAVDDLVWDWSGEGSTVKVAVIARETLAIAESMAAEHRFNPVSFVAVPDGAEFDGEPFFGPTALAPSVLGEADKVERDAEPVVILREAPKPEAGPAITEADLVPPVQDARDIEAEEEEAARQAALAAAAEAVLAQGPEAEVAETQVAESEIPKAQASEVPASEVPAAEAEPAEAQASFAEAPKAVAAPAPVAAKPDAVPQPVVAEAPMALDVADDPAVEDDLPPAPAAAISAAFANRRSEPVTAKPEAPEAEARSIGGVSRPGLAKPAAPAKAAPRSEPIAFPAKGAKPGKGKSLGVTATTIPGAPKRGKVITLANSATGDAASAETGEKPVRPTPVIKGRTPIGGKPRYLGLILTVGLLLLLAGVAVWSSFFMGTSEVTTPSPAETSGENSGAALDLPAADEAPANDPVQEAAVTPEAVADAAPEPTQAAAALPEAAPATAGTDLSTLSAPQTGLAAGPAPAPQAGQAGSEGIKLAAADTPPGVSAPQALAPLAAGVDREPAAPPVPPPFGTVYKFDANGLIEPTPEGIMTPEGVLLVAGKPPQVPPSRPAELTVVTATVVTAPVAEALPGAPGSLANPVEAAEPAPIADPSLEGLRPQARPADIAPPAEETPIQDGALALPVDPELADARPLPRPEGLVTVAAPAANNASLMASGAPLLTAPVTRAPRPPVKPTNLDRAVDDAVTAALDQPVAEEALALDEPEPDDAAPDLPTNASVARQATVENALNTRKLALLAVYGTSSNRFAMVRQPNGAVKKIRVGDAIDGGTVNAITANTIEYQKGGRMVTLALPTG